MVSIKLMMSVFITELVIQKYVLNELSKELLGGKINKDRPITIDSNGAGLVFKN